ncbi:hypothetical protein C0Q70_11931 [Pomacea canaliculata]|uniref:Uncharacterized protein n=1 Tax=Pomacea canaliculata TaxID=400727 RepID=A0A2T7P7F6_POMCA|nr:hypothetical protein C0Q70_11931 [Pomacea canaliculata]
MESVCRVSRVLCGWGQVPHGQKLCPTSQALVPQIYCPPASHLANTGGFRPKTPCVEKEALVTGVVRCECGADEAAVPPCPLPRPPAPPECVTASPFTAPVR